MKEGTFIEMCKGMKELQNEWEPKEGDYYMFHARDTDEYLFEYIGTCFDFNGKRKTWLIDNKKDCTFLPSLEQLIEGIWEYVDCPKEFLPGAITDMADTGCEVLYNKESLLDILTTHRYAKAWNWGTKEWESLI